jgi:hypothetical protein
MKTANAISIARSGTALTIATPAAAAGMASTPITMPSRTRTLP